LIEYKPASLPVSLRGELTYHRNGLKDDFFASEDPDFSGIEGTSARSISLGTRFSRWVTPPRPLGRT
jgi:hypothetical protein